MSRIIIENADILVLSGIVLFVANALKNIYLKMLDSASSAPTHPTGGNCPCPEVYPSDSSCIFTSCLSHSSTDRPPLDTSCIFTSFHQGSRENRPPLDTSCIFTGNQPSESARKSPPLTIPPASIATDISKSVDPPLACTEKKTRLSYINLVDCDDEPAASSNVQKSIDDSERYQVSSGCYNVDSACIGTYTGSSIQILQNK